MKVRGFGQTIRERCEYARKEEFVSVFEYERLGLQELALLLTANSEAAKQCLIRAFRECAASSSVSKEWAYRWTRRVVIRNAIHLLMGHGGVAFVNPNEDADQRLIAFATDGTPGLTGTSESILDLPQLERLVFVICVLECYSIQDCALLLGKSPREVDEVRHRVGNRVGKIDASGRSAQHFSADSELPFGAGGAK